MSRAVVKVTPLRWISLLQRKTKMSYLKVNFSVLNFVKFSSEFLHWSFYKIHHSNSKHLQSKIGIQFILYTFDKICVYISTALITHLRLVSFLQMKIKCVKLIKFPDIYFCEFLCSSKTCCNVTIFAFEFLVCIAYI